MKFTHRAALALSAACLAPLAASHTTIQDISFKVLAATLPKPISDHSAAVHNPHGTIYIAGGCDSPEGNVYISEIDMYACLSISSSVYVFNTVKSKLVEIAPMPRARYRHGAAVLNNKLWILGGRMLQDDAPVPEVDVYDIASGTWSTVGTLTVPASDQAVFTDGKAVYMVGGYDAGYDALATTTKLTLDSGALVQESKAALQYGRGDISAATDGVVAYVSGGWTDDDKFCVPQASVERYTVATDTWETLPDVMNIARAELGLVMLNEQLIALGGETALNTKCALNSSDVHELWAQTVAVDDVEVLDGDNWKFVSDLQDFRFRFAAVAVDAEEAIFTFGGQQAFNSTCNCFRTSNQIVVYQEVDHHAPPNSGARSVVGPMVSIAAVVVAGLF